MAAYLKEPLGAGNGTQARLTNRPPTRVFHQGLQSARRTARWPFV